MSFPKSAWPMPFRALPDTAKRQRFHFRKKNCRAVRKKVRNRQKNAEKYHPLPFFASERPSSGRKKTGTEQKKLLRARFFGICHCRNPACITHACDTCPRPLSCLRPQRAESGFPIGAIPRKQTHRRYNPLCAEVRKWSCRT